MLHESAVRSYSRAYPVTFDVARGAELWDDTGRRYLDFLSGCGSLNYGHNDPLLKEALLRYIERDGVAHGLDLRTCAKEAFLGALHEHAMRPAGLHDHVVQFTGPTGTNAVEAALKLARKVTGRQSVVCFTNGFHGVSNGALAVTGSEFHRAAAGTALSASTRVPYDGYHGTSLEPLELLDAMLDDPSSGVGRPCAAIVETVQGEGGCRAARVEWLQRLQAICRRHGMLFIIDDVQAGCGRTGTFFSFEDSGLDPDIVTLAKSLSGFGLPLAVALIRRSLDHWQPAEHNGTFRGNNHAFVTGAAALEHYWRDPAFATGIASRAGTVDAWLAMMQARHAPAITEVRGRGLMRGLVCADPEQAASISAQAFRNGLVIERSGPHDEVLKLLMPLTIEMSQLHEGLERLGSAIDDVLGVTGRADVAPDRPSRVVAPPPGTHAVI